MVKEFALYAGQISVYILMLNTVVLLFFYKKLPAQIKIILFYLLVGLFTELYSRWLLNQDIKNLFLLHIYTLLEFIAWSCFYFMLFKKKRWFQKKVPWFIGIMSVLIIANSIFLEPVTGFNSNAKTLVQFTLISYAVYYFFDAFGKIDLTNPLPRSISLINFAVILYYSGSLFIFMVPKMLTSIGADRSQINGLWAINSLLAVIFQILILISLWTVAFRKTKS